MSDNELNAMEQRKSSKRRRPEGVDYHAYKNRHLVSAKLTQTNWDVLRVWLVANKLNYNTGLNKLVATHPELQDHA